MKEYSFLSDHHLRHEGSAQRFGKWQVFNLVNQLEDNEIYNKVFLTI